MIYYFIFDFKIYFLNHDILISMNFFLLLFFIFNLIDIYFEFKFFLNLYSIHLILSHFIYLIFKTKDL